MAEAKKLIAAKKGDKGLTGMTVGRDMEIAHLELSALEQATTGYTGIHRAPARSSTLLAHHDKDVLYLLNDSGTNRCICLERRFIFGFRLLSDDINVGEAGATLVANVATGTR